MHDKKNTKSSWQKWAYSLGLCAMWCLFMVFLFNNASSSNIKHMEEQMLTQAKTLYSFVLDTRNWNAKHGGVYVRESEYGIANEWLPEDSRTINMPDGTRFILINPAYMSRQISEDSNLPGAYFKVTSQNPLRPENKADDWENEAFIQNAMGIPEVYSYVHTANNMSFRYLKPLYALESCLYCHKGIKEGAVLGGISISLDAGESLHNVGAQNKNLAFSYGFMAFFGSVCIGGIGLLRQRKQQIKEAKEKVKESFIANMSHDMRTPLAGIMGMTQLLRQDLTKDKLKQISEYLYISSASLSEMVSDITDYAALNSGRVKLNMTSFDLRQELEQCCAIFLPQCTAKGLVFEVCFAENLPQYLVGDAFRIRQILGNIINNAMKFTEEGKISVQVSFEDNGLYLKVIDTGIGIAKANQEQIYTRFERANMAGRNDIPGTGLGLAIVREMLELMHGTINVESDVGKGSCFTVFIPAQVTNSIAVNASKELLENKKYNHLCAGVKVLVAEDNNVTAYFVQTVLEKAGCVAHMCISGEDVMEKIADINPQIVFLDMRMPGINGLETAKKIREKEQFTHVPIVLMSASVLDVDAHDLQVLSIENVLLKPVSAQDIVNLVSNLTSHESEQDLPLFEHKLALSSLDYDEKLLQKLIFVWLEDYATTHAQLLLAVEQADIEKIYILAHAIKNSAATLNLSLLQQESAKVEDAISTQNFCDCSKLVETHKMTHNYLKSLYDDENTNY